MTRALSIRGGIEQRAGAGRYWLLLNLPPLVRLRRLGRALFLTHQFTPIRSGLARFISKARPRLRPRFSKRLIFYKRKRSEEVAAKNHKEAQKRSCMTDELALRIVQLFAAKHPTRRVGKRRSLGRHDESKRLHRSATDEWRKPGRPTSGPYDGSCSRRRCCPKVERIVPNALGLMRSGVTRTRWGQRVPSLLVGWMGTGRRGQECPRSFALLTWWRRRCSARSSGRR